MGKSTLQELFEWNAWANQQHRSVLSKIPFEELKMETKYGSLLDRVVHIFASFKMWMERIEGKSLSSVLTGDDFSSWKELATMWEEYDQLLISFVDGLEREELNQFVEYQRVIKLLP